MEDFDKVIFWVGTAFAFSKLLTGAFVYFKINDPHKHPGGVSATLFFFATIVFVISNPKFSKLTFNYLEGKAEIAKLDNQIKQKQESLVALKLEEPISRPVASESLKDPSSLVAEATDLKIVSDNKSRFTEAFLNGTSGVLAKFDWNKGCEAIIENVAKSPQNKGAYYTILAGPCFDKIKDEKLKLSLITSEYRCKALVVQINARKENDPSLKKLLSEFKENCNNSTLAMEIFQPAIRDDLKKAIKQ